MQPTKSTSILKEAFDAGYASFFTFDTSLDHRGKMKGTPVNPYYKGSLANKDFERGFNKAYFDNLRDTKAAAGYHDVGQDFSGN